ncbi:hypothetical protein DFH06DRAFT_1479447 [Mycena polygramma]|nr:hypothetical protein DFH06DRAFT_1479447 [Mycena polygramma]
MVVVAGGIVLGSLLAVETAAGKSQSEHWESSNIGIYIYGLARKETNEKRKHHFAKFRANLLPGSSTLFFSSSTSISPPWAGKGWNFGCSRVLRALDAGFNVFAMNLIQGQYLSERRATQEQRVFKYAIKGYGIRILQSYISSLKESQANFDIAEASRVWTVTVCLSDGDCEISHYDLESKHQISPEPQGKTMGYGPPYEDEWALGTYGDFPESIPSYDDILSHTWGEDFNVPDFEHEILNQYSHSLARYQSFLTIIAFSSFNLRQITQWLDNDGSLSMQTHGLDDDGDEFGPHQIWAVAKVLETAKDVVLPVSHKHLVVEPTSHDSGDDLFLWRLGKEMMWQQLDRRIDEVFEALYAFYRKERLITELSAWAMQPTVEDEFEAFARWVGRQPIFVRRFYDHVGSFDHMKGQKEQYKVADSDKESDEQ